MLGLGAPIFVGSSFWNFADFLRIRYSENSSGIEFPASRGVSRRKLSQNVYPQASLCVRENFIIKIKFVDDKKRFLIHKQAPDRKQRALSIYSKFPEFPVRR